MTSNPLVAMVIALAVGVGAPCAARAAESNQELKDQMAAAESELRRAQVGKLPPVELLPVRGRLMRLYHQAHWAKKFEEQAREILKLFVKANLPKNGGPESAWAAEAQFLLLAGRLDQALQSKIAVTKGAKASEALAAQIRALRQNVAGEEVPNPVGGIPERKGGLCGDYTTLVSSYRASDWTIAAAVTQSRLLSHVAELIRDTPNPSDQSADDLAQWRQIVDETARDLEAQALRLVEAAWTEIGRRNMDGQWRTEAKRELNRYLPRQHPLSRVRAEKWLIAVAEDTQGTLKTGGVLADIHGCYDRHLAAAPDEMLGEVQVKFTLGPDGTAKIAAVEHANPVVGQCLRRLWAQRKDLPRLAAPTELHVRLELAAL
ncbi:MAG: hypothetical protein FJ100_06580 [Deltaproteobacteria bacterium]|nr:hypothetical protein [Deltaproteobacteria bacterium]